MSPAELIRIIAVAIPLSLAVILGPVVMSKKAPAGDEPWERESPQIHHWFQTLMQPDNPRVSCCGDADAYEADSFEIEGDHYVAIITGQRYAAGIPLGTRVPVPNAKMKYDAGNPSGHGIIFIGTQGQVFCYVTPGGI